nr:N-6 DNA methylase [Paenibacillus phyllosphaerae]
MLPDSLDALFIRLEEIILANSGESDFEEIFKLILAKVWDEQQGLNLLRDHADESATIHAVNTLLGELSSHWTGILTETHTKLSPQHLAVCVGLLLPFRLTSYRFEALDAFFEYIVSRTAKGSKGQFFTPRHVVDFCIRMTNPKAGESVLDPACGSGAFLLHAFNYVKGASDQQWGFDYDDKAVRVARALLYIGGIEHPKIHKMNSLVSPHFQEQVLFHSLSEHMTTIEDVLRIDEAPEAFDVILTNPPFAGEITEKEILSSYYSSRGKTRIERDTLFLERCVQLLKPGGRMAIILPNSKFGAREFADVRRWLLQHVRIVGVVGLPNSSFMPHTSVKTSILFVQKRKTPLASIPAESIFFGISEKSGKDTRGTLEFVTSDNPSWDSLDHDLREIEEQFKQFLQQEQMGW